MTATTQDTDRTGTEDTAQRVLQELVFPAKDRFSTQPLYLDTRADTGTAVQQEDAREQRPQIVVNVASEPPTSSGVTILGRTSARVPPGAPSPSPRTSTRSRPATGGTTRTCARSCCACAPPVAAP